MSANCVRSDAEAVAQDAVSFSDELHVAILDTVVHHLHEVARTPGADVGDAGSVCNFRGDRFPNWANLFVSVRGRRRASGWVQAARLSRRRKFRSQS